MERGRRGAGVGSALLRLRHRRLRRAMPDPQQPLCSAGWGGWSCTDDTKAQSVGVQNLATLLLTLSNLMFLPAIAVAIHRCYLVEASVYTYTMFFSTVGIASVVPWLKSLVSNPSWSSAGTLGSLGKHFPACILPLQSSAAVLMFINT